MYQVVLPYASLFYAVGLGQVDLRHMGVYDNSTSPWWSSG